jgi:hypothetical protein
MVSHQPFCTGILLGFATDDAICTKAMNVLETATDNK